jgi:hypothetical protein
MLLYLKLQLKELRLFFMLFFSKQFFKNQMVLTLVFDFKN